MIRCCIFDLDGVIVDTARYHLKAWQALAHELGFVLPSYVAEATKGVSRMESLDIVLHAGGMESDFSAVRKQALADRKNATYLEYVARMTPAEVLPGVSAFLQELRLRGIKTALGSASKNAGMILDRCAMRPLFDVVVDGTDITRAKPDPEVFLRGAEQAGVVASDCVVFEDAAAGIEAASLAGMRSVGVGNSPFLAAATMCISSFEGFTFEKLYRSID